MRAEECTDGHSGPEFCLDGADFRVFCRRVHIEAMHLDRHAATPSHAHDGEATEDLILNRVYGMLSAGKYEFLPCFLHVLEDAQIGLEVIPCGGLDVGVSELSRDYADVGSGLDRQRAECVA